MIQSSVPLLGQVSEASPSMDVAPKPKRRDSDNHDDFGEMYHQPDQKQDFEPVEKATNEVIDLRSDGGLDHSKTSTEIRRSHYVEPQRAIPNPESPEVAGLHISPSIKGESVEISAAESIILPPEKYDSVSLPTQEAIGVLAPTTEMISVEHPIQIDVDETKANVAQEMPIDGMANALVPVRGAAATNLIDAATPQEVGMTDIKSALVLEDRQADADNFPVEETGDVEDGQIIAQSTENSADNERDDDEKDIVQAQSKTAQSEVADLSSSTMTAVLARSELTPKIDTRSSVGVDAKSSHGLQFVRPVNGSKGMTDIVDTLKGDVDHADNVSLEPNVETEEDSHGTERPQHRSSEKTAMTGPAPQFTAIQGTGATIAAIDSSVALIDEQIEVATGPTLHAASEAQSVPRSGGLTSAAYAQPALTNQIVAQVSKAIDDTKSPNFEITLDPEELGKVRIVMMPRETGISVFISADRPETLEMMRRNSEQLAENLADLGYSQPDFNFSGNDDRKEQDHSQSSPLDWTDEGEVTSGYPVHSIPVTDLVAGLDLKL